MTSRSQQHPTARGEAGFRVEELYDAGTVVIRSAIDPISLQADPAQDRKRAFKNALGEADRRRCRSIPTRGCPPMRSHQGLLLRGPEHIKHPLEGTREARPAPSSHHPRVDDAGKRAG